MRTSTIAASVPSTVAMCAERSATRIVTQAAFIRPSLLRSPAYQWVDQPPQTVTSLEFVEAVDHEQQDRDVEERKPERDRGDVEPGEGLLMPASRWFC